MKINETILKVIKSNNNMITTAQAVELGFTRSLLVCKRRVIRTWLQRGLYSA